MCVCVRACVCVREVGGGGGITPISPFFMNQYGAAYNFTVSQLLQLI